jgi:hypothetical protein
VKTLPLYEYICEETGDVMELLRPIGQADAPVDDPERKGRQFVRKVSTFAPLGGGSASSASASSGKSVSLGGCCPCGKSQGMCGRG